MLESESNPSFFQTVAKRIAALAKQSTDNDQFVADGPIEVSLLTLEDRVLYSAVPVPVDLVVQVDAIDASIDDASALLFEPAAEPLLDFHSEYATDDGAEVDFADVDFLDVDYLDVNLSDVDDASLIVEVESPTVTRELIVVDRGVEGYQQLVDDLLVSTSGNRTFEIIHLDSATSGIDSLGRQLNERVSHGTDPYDALHLITHGSEGAIQLGSDRLSAGNLHEFEESVAQWGSALAIDADLLIYGCDVASSESGMDFIDSLASLTGADVTASDDVTGHQTLGGDWDFEYTVGLVESGVVFSQTVQQNWEHSLETRVTTAESGGQSQSIGIDATGRSAIVTSVENDTTDGLDVLLQFADGSGNIFEEIVVNETLAGDQVFASVAVADSGTTAVTWTSISTTGERAVFAKVYDANNNVARSEFRVDMPTAGVEADDSSIAIDAQGNFVIVWESAGSGVSEILGQRFANTGAADGAIFEVSGGGSAGLNESANASVAANDIGQFVVVWDTDDGSPDDRSNIYARTFSVNGFPVTSPFIVQERNGVQNTQASVDIDSNGNSIVAYTFDDLNDPSRELDVRAESFRLDGTFVTSYENFVDAPDGDQFGTSVALLDDGTALITWEGQGVDASGAIVSQDVFASTVNYETGNVILPQSLLAPSETGQASDVNFSPSVTTSSASSFASVVLRGDPSNAVVVAQGIPSEGSFHDNQVLAQEDIALTIFSPQFGSPLNPNGDAVEEVLITQTPQNGRLLLDGIEVNNGQVISANDIVSGNLVYISNADYSGQDNLTFLVSDGVSFTENASTLTFAVQPVVDDVVASLGSSYISTSGGIPVNSSIEGDQNSPKITALDDGGYVVVWESVDTNLTDDSDGNGDTDDGQQIYFQRFDVSNNKIGPEVLVGGSLNGDQTRPSIVTLADGSFVVGLTSISDVGETDIYAQRFDQNGNIFPTAGAVDVNGTLVIPLAQHTRLEQGFLTLTALREGGFIAAWATQDTTLESDTSYATVARIFDAAGNPSDEFLLNNADVDQSSGQFTPRVAELNNGSIVATWYNTTTLPSDVSLI